MKCSRWACRLGRVTILETVDQYAAVMTWEQVGPLWESFSVHCSADSLRS